MKNLGNLEKFLLFFGLFTFLFLSFVIVFKREWLDNIFQRPVPYYIFQQEENTIERTLVSVDVRPSNLAGKGDIYLNLESSSKLTGVELFFEKDDSLEISNFVCNSPFECLFFDVDENSIDLAVLSPLSDIETFYPGEVLLGTFDYSGNGNLYFRFGNNSFASDIQNPEINILNLDERIFLF